MTVIVVVLEEAANIVDVDVATVLMSPVATQEQTVDTTLLGWPRRATKGQKCTITFVWDYLPGRSTGSRAPSNWAFLRYRTYEGVLMGSSLFPAALPMVPVYRVSVSTCVAVMTLVEVKVVAALVTLSLMSMFFW